nr:hypothetical protein [Tanacetum cinerariifolium]
MALTFADTHNMIAYLTKSDASEGFNQIIDFLNASSIKYALTVNPNIYLSCIKQFWTSVSVKKVNDVTRLQAPVDKKRVIITKATIRDALRLDDAEGIDCLPNEEIFAELSRMGYEKPSTKLTFYKAFFSQKWKFLIHTILQCMSAKRTSWNEFSSSMASAVICLSTGRKFNFSKAQVGDLSLHTTKYSSPALTQKVFPKMRRVGKGCSGVETPLFEGMIVAAQAGEGATEANVDDVPADGVANEGASSVADDVVTAAVDKPYIPSPTPPTQSSPPSQDIPSTSQVQHTPPPSLIAQPPSPQQQPQPSQDAEIFMDLLHNLLDTCTTLTRRVENLEQDKIAQALEITKVDTSDDTIMDDVSKHGRIIADMDADVDVIMKDIAKDVGVDAEIKESADVQGRQAESQAQIYQIDLEHADKVLSMLDDEVEPAELQEVVEIVTTAKLITKVVTADSTTITAAAPQLTTVAAPTLTTAPSAARRRNGVVIRDPEETATPSIIIHTEAKSKYKGKWILVEEPKPLKKQAQIEQDEAYARELKAELNKNIDWDEVINHMQRKVKDDNAMKRKLDEEVVDLKRHLQIVVNDDDDVNTEATPLARKVPVDDYEIYTENNKPYYKIITADGSPQLFLSFLSLLRNFDREDLEVLWELIKESFGVDAAKDFKENMLSD